MIEIDGSHAEGGGAILRYALALSTLTGKPFRMFNVRKGRDKPGLKPQHLHCIKGLKELCGSTAELGSLEVEYHPKPVSKNRLKIDIGTAGSITLLLQSFILPILFSEKKVELWIKGGTDVPYSPPMEYFANVFIPSIEKYGNFDIFPEKRGFYPRGGGILSMKIEPGECNEPIILDERGPLKSIYGIAFATNTLKNVRVVERMKKATIQALRELDQLHIREEYAESDSDGAITTLWADYGTVRLAGDCLGKKGLKAEKVGCIAGLNLKKEMDSGACADKYLADQLIPFMAVTTLKTGKESRIITSEISNHLRSNIYISELFLPVKFSIDKIVRCCKL